MQTVDERLSKLEAVQHFHQALIGAVAKTCADHPDFKNYVRENLRTQHALLIGESRDEVKVSAFEELMEELLGKAPE